MLSTDGTSPKVFKAYKHTDIARLPQLAHMGKDQLEAVQAVAHVLPFRVNNYVVEELIDWDNLPNDPMFQLTFPQPGMLRQDDLDEMIGAIRRDEDAASLQKRARRIQVGLNPHPAGQMELNVPLSDDGPVGGTQHKYGQTILFFPSQGQTCHAYCTYCFRWAQFVGMDDLKFATKEVNQLVAYLKDHEEITDVLITGGDPMIMKTKLLRRYIEPLLEVESLRNIRIGTKAPAYWPYRFVTDRDADDLMRLFEEVIAAGKHLALMAHFSHPKELDTPIAAKAIQRIRATGAVVRCQAPLIRHVNDSPEIWSTMWKKQVALGAIPYYMFVERDTGPKQYFEVPLAKAFDIFTKAYRDVSGLSRTVRGPSMSATPGKVLVDGVMEIAGERYFALKFIQARDEAWVNQIFLAEYDENASWLGDLRPAFGQDEFFFEPRLRDLKEERRSLLEKRNQFLASQLATTAN